MCCVLGYPAALQDVKMETNASSDPPCSTVECLAAGWDGSTTCHASEPYINQGPAKAEGTRLCSVQLGFILHTEPPAVHISV